MAPDRVRGVTVPVEQRVRFGRGKESLEDGGAGERDGEGEEAAGEKLGMDGDVGMDVQKRRGGKRAEAVEPGKDFIVEDGKAGPV